MDRVRVLVQTPASPQVSFLANETGEDADADVTVTVTRADGTVIATDAATSAVGGGVYSYALDPQARLDLITLAWSGTFGGLDATVPTQVEIVGGFYVGLDKIRTQPNVDSHAKWDTVDLARARDWFEDLAEDVTGVAWVPRFAREKVSGPRCSDAVILRHHPVRAVTSVRSYTSAAAYTSFTVDELADLDVTDSGIVRRQWLGSWPSGKRNLVFEYEHGYDAPPADLREAALVAIRDKLLGDRTGSRQLSVSTEQGIVRSATASADFPVGIPFVDAVLNRLRKHRAPAIA